MIKYFLKLSPFRARFISVGLLYWSADWLQSAQQLACPVPSPAPHTIVQLHHPYLWFGTLLLASPVPDRPLKLRRQQRLPMAKSRWKIPGFMRPWRLWRRGKPPWTKGRTMGGGRSRVQILLPKSPHRLKVTGGWRSGSFLPAMGCAFRQFKTPWMRTWTWQKSLPGGSLSCWPGNTDEKECGPVRSFGHAGHCHHGQVAVSFHMLETRQKSKQWTIRAAWTVKAKVHATRSKQMVVAFLTTKSSSTPITSPGAKRWTLIILWMPWAGS